MNGCGEGVENLVQFENSIETCADCIPKMLCFVRDLANEVFTQKEF